MLTGKTAVITGGATGIGRAIAQAYAAAGANVVINYNRTVPENLCAGGVAVQADVSDFAQAKALIEAAKEKFGGVDILVNNAGITKDNLILRMSEADFDDVVNVNLKGTFNTIKHVTPIMLKAKHGTIINITSVSGVLGNVGQANYAASKAGVIGLTKTMARELAPKNITVNAIAPGYIQTQMTEVLPQAFRETVTQTIPLKRFGLAEEIASLAVYLPSNGYITGQVICVDGGMAM
jgi:3-oxoacyl-[acyl-carrier protein] reductase